MRRAWWLWIALLVAGCGNMPAASPPRPKPRAAAPVAPRLLVPRPPDVDHYLRLLKSSDPDDQAHAAFHLADRAQWAAAAVPDLVRMLDEHDGNRPIVGVGKTREEAARALAAIGEPALDAVLPRLSDRWGPARVQAVQIIGGIDGPRAEQALLAHLGDSDAAVRRALVQPLARRRGRAVADGLLTLLGDDDDDVRGHAAEALGQLGDARAAAPLVKLLGKEQGDWEAAALTPLDRVAQALLGLGAPAVEPLLDMARGGHTKGARRAVLLLGLMDDPRANEWRLAALDDPDPEVRALAVRTFAERDPELRWYMERRRPAPDPRALPALRRALTDKWEGVRADAAVALGGFGSPSLVPDLIRILKTGGPSERMSAITALARTDHPRAERAVLAALSDPQLEQVAMRAIGRCGRHYATGRLVAIIGEAEGRERFGTRQAVAVYALRDLRDPKAVPALKKVVLTGEGDTQRQAAAALAETGDEAAREALLACLHDRRQEVRENGLYGFTFVAEPRAREALLAALTSDRVTVRWLAAQGLGRLRDRTATRPLLDAFARHRTADGPDAPRAILDALRQIGDRAAVPSLILILDHYHAVYRPEAAAALKQITGRDLGENPLVWQAWWTQQGGK